MQAQTIEIDSIFNSDGEIFPFSPNDTIYGLSISGSVTLSSDTSLVRVILTDIYGQEWMVYEAYPMIVTDTAFEIVEECDETCFLDGVNPISLRIQLSCANFLVDFLILENVAVPEIESRIFENIQYQDARKVEAINFYIDKTHMPWVAGSTSLSLMSYSSKKILFGDKFKLFGYDYYIGGIFNPSPFITCEIDNSPLVTKFDWREKHNAHLDNHFYHDGDLDESHRCYETFHEYGNGWLTKVKDQDPLDPPDCLNVCNGCCYIFSPLGVMEAMTNLFFNYHYDLDLSEQHVLNCSYPLWNTCSGGSSHYVFNMAKKDETEPNEGIIDEISMPWIDNDVIECDENPEYITRLSFENFTHDGFTGNPPIDAIKENLILHGPMRATIDLPGSGPNHDVVLVGYGVLQENDVFHANNGGDIIHVSEYPEYIGSLYWICKNSYSAKWGSNGYFNFIQNSQHEYFYPISQYTYINTPIYLENSDPNTEYVRHCYDYDNDGYYNWGLGEFDPLLCDQLCENLNEDSNDDNDRIGPYDDFYNGKPIMPAMKVYLSPPQSVTGRYFLNNSFFSFSDDDLRDGEYLHFYVENSGDAQLNLRPWGFNGERPVEITEIEGGSPNFSIDDPGQPQREVCMDNSNLFKIKFTGQVQGELTKIKIYLDENGDIPDFEFILVYNDCQPATEIEPITEDETWSNFELRNQDYLISRGVTVTVTGNIAMGVTSDIFIQNGGELIIDGGRLTAACGELWNGIDVWGDRRHPQLVESQGTVRVKNGGMIEFARCAIENIIWMGDVSAYTGGIFDVDEGIFKDNLVAIRFWPYHNYNPGTGQPMGNFSRIKNSEFKTTQNLYDLKFSPNCFISMTEVEGIKIMASNFYNEVMNIEEAGTGIFSTGSDFIVDHYCTEPQVPCLGYTPCHFENLEYGIHAGSITSVELVRIKNSEFINNLTGIYLGASVSPEVTQNLFEVRKTTPVPFNEAVYCGLYLDQCTGYQVEENFFYTFFDDQQREDLQAVGLVVHNSGPENNDIYNNIFDGLYTGLIAQEVNRSNDGGIGLQIKCNVFNNDIFDVAITQSSPGTNGIAKEQGSENNYETAPASNLFTLIEPGQNLEPDGNYYNICNDIIYWHHANTTGFNLIPSRHTDFPAVEPKPGNYLESFDMIKSCPSNLENGSGIEVEKENMFIAGQNADSVKNLLNLLIDGGDTEGLINEIQSSWPEEGYELYSTLISESPYLSDTSMIKAIEKEDVLLPGMITDVLIANPQSAKSEIVMNAVDERDNQLTENQIADIGEGRFIISAKEALESYRVHYQYIMDRSKNNLVRLFKADTLIDSPGDSIIEILNFQPRLSDEYFKAFEDIKMGDSMDAVNTLDAIPGNYDFNSTELIEHSLYEDYIELILEQDTVSSLIFDMDSVQKAICYNILENSSYRLKGYVRNLLVINDSLDYKEVIILPEPGLKTGKVRFWPDKKNITENSLKIYPNPARNAVIIETQLKEEPREAVINLIDGKGIIVKTYPISNQNTYLVIPLFDFQPGMLFCQLLIRNKIIESGKIVVIK